MTDSLEERFTRQDRDRLIVLDSKVDSLIKTVDEIRDNTTSRLEALEANAADKKDVNIIYETRNPAWRDFNMRLDRLENWRSYILGILSVIGVVAAILTYIYFQQYDTLKVNITSIQTLLEHHIDSTSAK